MKINILLLLLGGVFYSVMNAQPINSYQYHDQDSLNTYLKEINSGFIKEIEGKYASKIKEKYRYYDKSFSKRLSDSVYFFDKELSGYLKGILKNIYSANTDIDSKNFFFFVKNAITPNAACYGDGTFEINVGLFPFFKTDDEVAFVLCHEIAHYVLDHSLNGAYDWAEALFSKNTKKKIKTISRMEYGRTRAGMALIDDISFDIHNQSKETESQADSLGLKLFSKTKYKMEASVSALQKFDKVEELYLNYPLQLDSIFSFKDYPFKKYWLDVESSFFNAEKKINDFKLDSDTLKTHPEVPYRIEKLQKDFSLKEIKDLKLLNMPRNIVEKTAMQSVQYVMDFKRYDIAIYQLIRLFKSKQISETYYYEKMAGALRGIYELKKKHQLGKFIKLNNTYSKEKALNKVKTLISNLEIKEIRKIGFYFCESYQDIPINSAKFNEIHTFFKQLQK